jgi:hypothetical protein
MAAEAETPYLEFEFPEFESPVLPESNDPFTINSDGSIDLDLSGKLDVNKVAKFNNNVNIPSGNLIVQGVNILNEINSIKQFVGMTP